MKAVVEKQLILALKACVYLKKLDLKNSHRKFSKILWKAQ